MPDPGKTALLVDDDPDVRALVRAIVEEFCVVREASSLTEAREAIAKEMPSLIILDRKLPDGEGEDLLTDVPRTVPVIALTGAGRILVSPGKIVSYVPKPFNPDALRMIIRSALS